MTVGERIKQRRLELGWTQEELALKLGCKSRSSVNKVELSNDLTLKTVRAYANALGVDATYLMGWKEDEKSKFSYVQDSAIVEFILNAYNQNLIDIINKMNPTQKEELLHYAMYLIGKEED